MTAQHKEGVQKSWCRNGTKNHVNSSKKYICSGFEGLNSIRGFVSGVGFFSANNKLKIIV